MNQKKDFDKIYAEIRASFPGEVVKRVSEHGVVKRYIFTKEQSEWLQANCTKRFPINSIAKALGISESPIVRELAKHDAEMLERMSRERRIHYEAYQARRDAKKFGMSTQEYRELIRRSDPDKVRNELAEKRKAHEEQNTEAARSLKFYNDMMKEAEKERKKKERAAERERKKADKEDAAYAAECLKRFPHERKREPIPFTKEQEDVRIAMYKRGYILADGEELLTDNRTNVYWDADTKRSNKLEARAIAAKLSVIKYSDMFPDMSNRMSSCKADCAQRDFYQMN